MKSKKAQSMPMNAIVIAAIVLVVMVVLILIFTGGIGTWRQDKDTTQSEAMARAQCIGKGGTVEKRSDCLTDTEIERDLGQGLVCCIEKVEFEEAKTGIEGMTEEEKSDIPRSSPE